jgi:L-asparaginase
MGDISAGLAELELLDFRSVSSSALTLDDVTGLAHLIHARTDTSTQGVLIVQGTDTMEETAWALASMLTAAMPIAITGAMRIPTHPSRDGDGNVLDALRVALHPDARGVGPVVVMAGEIHLARWVRKVETSGTHALQSPGFGPIGAIVEDQVHIWARSTREDYLGLPESLTARVEIVGVELGGDELPLLAAAQRSDGIVIAAAGGGHVPPRMADAIGSVISDGVPVVLASRTLGGRVLERTYNGPGSESDLIRRGVHPAGFLPPLKARVRLAVALSLGLPAANAFPA